VLLRRVILTTIVTACVGCDSIDSVTNPDADFPITVTVSNKLVAPVTISVDGDAIIGLSGGASSQLTVSSKTQWLTWISAKPMDSEGHPIQDDLGEVKVLFGGINRTLEIQNVVQDQTYITASIFNNTVADISIGVFDGTSVACAAALPGKAGVVRGFTQIGYYRLLPTTVLRAYRDPKNCTGPFSSWSPEQLKTFEAKSGLLTLTVESPP